MPAVTTASPGYPFAQIVASLPQDALVELLGEATCELIKLVDRGELAVERLRAVAVSSLEPERLLSDEGYRKQFIAMLPPDKRQELATRLGAPESAAADAFLAEVPWTDAQRRQLLGFFGLLVERSPETPKPARLEREAGYGLFPHQRRAAARAQEELYRGQRRVVLHLPTGVGKTRTAMSMVCDHLRRSEPTTVVWLAHGRELLEQAATEFERAWANLGDRPIGVTRAWGAGSVEVEPRNDGLLVLGLEKATALARADRRFLDHLGSVTTLTVFDEAHQAVARTYRSVADALTLRRDASLLGLTATPGRTWSDISADEDLADFFGRQKVALEIDGYDNPVTGLIDQGYLARPTFTTIAADSEMKLGRADLNNLAEAYDLPPSVVAAISMNAKWNLQVIRAVVDLAERHHRILLFAASVEHSRLLVSLLSLLGLEAAEVTGASSARHRDRTIARFKGNSPGPMVLSNFGVLTTGFDAPAASAAVIARPTLSLVLYSQMAGRVLRGPKAGGTPACEVVTVIDPALPGFGSVAEAFVNWEDVWTSR